MVNSGISYTNANTPFPSDSFPGLVGQVTGGNPKTTGIYYDDAYSRALLPVGSPNKGGTSCKGIALGAETGYFENLEPLDKNGNITIDAGQNIPNVYPIETTLVPGYPASVPASILSLVGSPADVRSKLIDPANLPVDPKTCTPVYPHQYLQVNTIFEVAKKHKLHTAWTDKHPAYEILNGPSGLGIDDLFAPEINGVVSNVALDPKNAVDWTKDNTDTQKYDTIKVASILNEIKGFDHSGVKTTGTPAIFGMNFQAVSVAQKLNTSSTPEQPKNAKQLGGYIGSTPGPVLESALKFVSDSLEQMEDAISGNPDTVIIVSAKHGQSPKLRSDLTIINDGDMINALEVAWSKTNQKIKPLVAHAMDDDGVLLWLNDRSDTALTFAKTFLTNYTGTCISSDANGAKISKTFTNAGLSAIYTGANAAKQLGLTTADQRYPDVIGYAKIGSVYGGGKLSKIAEHGGNAIADRHVPIIISGATINHAVESKTVSTVQIAPSILHLLGLDPQELQAVKAEKTAVLPSLK